MGLISLVHRGAHATGLLLVGPLFAVLDPEAVFAGAAVALPIVGLAGLAAAQRLSTPVPSLPPTHPGDRQGR
jgi:hypothetical protein